MSCSVLMWNSCGQSLIRGRGWSHLKEPGWEKDSTGASGSSPFLRHCHTVSPGRVRCSNFLGFAVSPRLQLGDAVTKAETSLQQQLHHAFTLGGHAWALVLAARQTFRTSRFLKIFPGEWNQESWTFGWVRWFKSFNWNPKNRYSFISDL